MSLRVFYAAILLALISVMGLSLLWEFALEDRLLPMLVSHHEIEGPETRWEYVVTTTCFAAIAMIGPLVIGTRILLRDRVVRQTMIRLSQEDHLTGLFNRRRVAELLENEIQRANRYKTAFSVTMMDIDDFKAINDRFGHKAGDDVLVRIAEVIRSGVRSTDLVGRWGGEEFVIISPETDIDGSFSMAEKIRALIEATELGEFGLITASFGVTAFNGGDDLDAVIGRADAGMYAAKRSGRNRIEKVPIEGMAQQKSAIGGGDKG